jgi:hypothetical protein
MTSASSARGARLLWVDDPSWYDSLSVMQFIAQPFAEIRLGEFLLGHLADPQWTAFRAAIAFVKRSGTRHIRQPLRNFCDRAQVKLSVGVDLYGTSREGLTDLLDATTPNGQIFIYRNNGPYTFHPKVYVFKSAQRADIIVGSGNLTGGGLFTNYEASLVASLDLTLRTDAELLQAIEGTLDTWSEPQQGVCYALTPEFLNQLVTSGLVPSEAQLAALLRSEGFAKSQWHHSTLLPPPHYCWNGNESSRKGNAYPVVSVPDIEQTILSLCHDHGILLGIGQPILR